MARPTSQRNLVALLLVTAIAAPAGAARTTDGGADEWCGTHDTLLEQSIAKHRHFERLDRMARRQARRAGGVKADRLPGGALEVRKEGNIAVAIDNDGRMIRDRNFVDLEDGFAMQFKFKKKQGGYQTKTGGAFGSTLGDLLDLTDDDSTRIDLPFAVKVFGQRYNSVFVNSDGNLTFGEPDPLSTFRDFSRFLDGPPRLAPFFADLNPETAPAGGGIFALVGAKSLRVTWVRVPEFDENNAAGQLNTFQVTLAKNGKVSFAYGEINSREGIVGIAPGGGSTLTLLDYTQQLPAPVAPAAIAESFSSQLSIDDAAIAKVFLENFSDRYQGLVVFTDFPLVLLGQAGVIAYNQSIQNDIRGIGSQVFDTSRFYGSSGALESFVMMGEVSKYGSDIESPNQIGGVYSALDILMHEIGHRWGVRLALGQGGGELLGRGSHWSYCFSSKNSYLEGNPWQANGDGSFSIFRERAIFNDFDLYSMGLLSPDAVESSFYIQGQCVADRAPAAEGGANGEQVEVSIDAVIQANGPRNPSFADARKKFEWAYMLLVKPGEEPKPGSVALVNALRKGSEGRLKEQGGSLKTKLKARK